MISNRLSFGSLRALTCLIAVIAAASAQAIQVFVPDNGFGTARMPIAADYTSETPMQIIDGLPVGSTIDIDATLLAPPVAAEQVGGSLGGTQSGGGGVGLFKFEMQGTGVYSAFTRTITFPINGGHVLSFPHVNFLPPDSGQEVHAAPRTLNAPYQSFDTSMFRLFTQITGDPDFDLLRVVGGTDFGLPSPGHTTLLQAGPNWEVESFFDLTYRIDFVGKTGGTFSGRSGSTTATVRISLGEPIPNPVPEPTSFVLMGLAIAGAVAMLRRRR